MLHHLQTALQKVCLSKGKATCLFFEQDSYHTVRFIHLYKGLDRVSKHGLSVEGHIHGTVAVLVKLDVAALVSLILKGEQEDCSALAIVATTAVLYTLADSILDY